ncbi:MAG: aminotransferase class IV [Bacteroidales bacterium]|nr:aminotransferase class IV [Bacteroidales bacterium]
MARHLMLNSEILPADKPCLFANNRGLKYGDAFSILLRGNSSKVFLFEQNFDFFIEYMRKSKMQVPVLFEKSIFATDIELLLQKNRIYQGFKAEVTVFRNASETKLSDDNTVSVLITVEKNETEWFKLNNKGLKIDVADWFYIPDFICKNSAYPVFSEEFLLKSNLNFSEADQWLLIDEKQIILRTTDAVLFCTKGKSIYIPKNILPNYYNVFVNFALLTLQELGYQVYKADITRADLIEFDELFLIDPVNGIRWCLAYKGKRYFHKTSDILLDAINKLLQNNQDE